MKLKYTFKAAIVGLKTNKSRSGLTILGIVIGITAIILVMAISSGANQLILAQIQGLGSQTIIVRAGGEPKGPSDITSIFSASLKDRELSAIKNPALVRGVSMVMPNVVGSAIALYGGETKNASMLGTMPGILEIFAMQPAEGDMFTEMDVRSRASVVVIGSEVKKTLFGLSDAVGETIKLNSRNFKVIGVFGKIGQMGIFDVDNTVMIPVSTAQTYMLGITHYNSMIVKAASEAAVEQTARDIKTTLRELHNITDPDKDDFFVATQADLALRVGSITGVLGALLASIAAISLLVGGIGIMNIMLVSVTERTREIGLRKALGATEKNILTQFLIEAITLTAIGGVIGITLGALFSFTAAIILSQVVGLNWSFSFPISAAVLGISVSAGIGLLFGLYPARQASMKSPIEALRYE